MQASLTRRDRLTLYLQRFELTINCGAAVFVFFAVAVALGAVTYDFAEQFDYDFWAFYQVKKLNFWIGTSMGVGLLYYTQRVARRTILMLRKFAHDAQGGFKLQGRGYVTTIIKPYRAGPVAIIDAQDGSPHKWARIDSKTWAAMEALPPGHRECQFWYVPHSNFAFGLTPASVELIAEVRHQKRVLRNWAIAVAVIVALLCLKNCA